MNYVAFNAGNKDYMLRLNTKNTVALEKALGCNPLSIFDATGATLPAVSTLVTVLHASLQQYQHGISLVDTYDIFDAYLENNTIEDFIYVVLDIYRVSGLIPKETEKN